MTRPLVTIVSPVYNHERFVGSCIESVLRQSYQEWEQIVVDDGSTDRTREIVASFGDPRIRVIALPHRGLGALAETYNTALAAARGALVAVLEGDDLWPSDKLERQVPLFEDPAVTLTWGRGLQVAADGSAAGSQVRVRGRSPQVQLSTSDAFLRLTRTNLLAPSVTVMVRRSALDAIGGFRQTGSDLFVDLPTWLWVTARHDGCVTFLNHVLGIYRVHAMQTTQRKRMEMMQQHLEVVLAVEGALSPDDLRRVGWNATHRARALRRGKLAEGERWLAQRAYADALGSFRDALRVGGGIADGAFACLGIASALVRVDLVRPAFAMREWLRDVSGR